jgi:hypothetical protein
MNVISITVSQSKSAELSNLLTGSRYFTEWPLNSGLRQSYLHSKSYVTYGLLAYDTVILRF